jgi:flavin reductase (DIM6/NTAB) family NADH-FMN oxidoreductase RutF
MSLNQSALPEARTSKVQDMTDSQIDPRRYRDVLGHFPTGVTVVTGLDSSGAPHGMTIGSFSS